jgi:serine/threonine protein kinase
MTAGGEPAGPNTRPKSEGTTLVWLDALANGHCAPEIFLDAMRQQFLEDPEQSWEVLSLLDQYYRRGRIKPEIFHALKARLQNSAIAGREDEAARIAASSAARRAAVTPSAGSSAAVSAATTPVTLTTPVVPATPPPPTTPLTAAPPGTPTPPVTPITPAATPLYASRPAPPPQARAAAREPAIGDVLRDRYSLRSLVGRGSMGTVFEMMDTYRVDMAGTSQRAAIRILHPAVSQREELLAVLQREFQHMQLLSHPCIVRVHEFDRDGEIAFFTMEFLDGALLSQVFGARQMQPLQRPHALAILRDVGAALAYAHSRGVAHGDVNPRNIAITKAGELRVLDFGASQRASTGTSGYASCEVLEGRPPDVRDDVFSLAWLACVLLSGQHPFPNRNAIEASAQRVRPRRPPNLTRRQWRVLRDGLCWEREKRPTDLGAWLAGFDLSGAAAHLPPLPQLVKVSPVRHRKMMLWAAGTAAALLAAAGIWVLMNKRDVLSSGSAPIMTQPPSAPAPAADGSAAPATAASVPAFTPAPAPAPAPAAAPAPAPAPASAPLHAPSTAAAPAPSTAPAPSAASAPSAAPAPPAARAATPAAPTRPAKHDPVRVELAADTVEVATGETAAHVVVRRKGSLRGEASFTWWTESGTAKPGQDFAPVAPHLEQVDEGSSSAVLSIPVSGAPHSQPKSFYVVIDRSDSGAPVGARTLTMVTLLPAD